MVGSGLAGIPRRLWLDAKVASHRLLMLDYDGTLAPFRIDRREAFPLPGAVERLDAIAARGATRVAVVSGRPIAELDLLLGPLEATLIGEHGWEEREPGGPILQELMPEIARAALERAAEAASGCDWQDRLERKRTSLVLHTRGLPPEEASRIESECEALWWFVEGAGLQRRSVNGGVELRACGRGKGTAVRHLIASSPLRPFAVYLGDDDTDEDAFGAVQPDGYGIRIGPASYPSRAVGRLTSWEAVPQFLDKWSLVVERMSDWR